MILSVIFEIILCRLEKKKLKEIEVKNIDDIATNTESIITYITKTCELIAQLKYAEWRDAHDLSKITRESLKNLSAETAKAVYDYIDIKSLTLTDTMITKDYINWLIVNYTFTFIKHMYDKDME